MSIESSRIALRDPVAHRELGTIHTIHLVYGAFSASSFMWPFIAPDGTIEFSVWRLKLSSPGMIFANITESADGTSCQLYSTYLTDNTEDPIGYAPQLLMGNIIDPRTGKPWDPNIGFYSNVAN